MNGNVFANNLVYWSGAVPGNMYQVNIDSYDALPWNTTNLYFSPTRQSVPNGPTVVDANPIYADPGFTNPSAGDYGMPSYSSAYNQAMFQPLPTDQGPLPYTPDF
jgi:hypothetical protein